jgi:hypothetical protein
MKDEKTPHSVEVEVNAAGMGTIKVDGELVRRTRSINIQSEAGKLTHVEVTIVPMNGVKFTGPASVDVAQRCPFCGHVTDVELPIVADVTAQDAPEGFRQLVEKK